VHGQNSGGTKPLMLNAKLLAAQKDTSKKQADWNACVLPEKK
jgi:hypothetical protein